MFDDDLDYPIRMAINQLMLVLYQQGITEIHTGGLMRLLGVPNEVSQNYDDERIILDDDFVKYVSEFSSPRSSDQLLH
jgi:hypothetical protein